MNFKISANIRCQINEEKLNTMLIDFFEKNDISIDEMLIFETELETDITRLAVCGDCSNCECQLPRPTAKALEVEACNCPVV